MYHLALYYKLSILPNLYLNQSSYIAYNTLPLPYPGKIAIIHLPMFQANSYQNYLDT